MLLAASFVLALLPQGAVHGRPNRLILPKPKTELPTEAPTKAQDPRAELFHQRVLELRRSLHIARSKELALVKKVGEEFDGLSKLALDLLRRTDADAAYGVLVVLQHYGVAEDADEIKFLLLTRPLGAATRTAVETMATLARERGKDCLFECLTAANARVRRAAAEVLEPLVGADDAERLIVLSKDGDLDIRIKTLRLLGEVPADSARTRLMQALSETSIVAEAAVTALVEQGEPAVSVLQDTLRKPAGGRAYGYAALTLALLEAKVESPLFTDDMREHLLHELTMPDSFMQSAVALGLAGLAWRSDDVTGRVYDDKRVVEGMLQVVAPIEFVPHLALLSDPAQLRLTLFTGREFGGRPALWREWWTRLPDSAGYVGSRRRVALTDENAPGALLTFSGTATTVRMRGERVEGLEPKEDVLDLLLTVEELKALVARLVQDGFMGPPRGGDGPADPRRLKLAIGGAVCLSDPRLPAQLLDRYGNHVRQVLDVEAWQLYRDPEREPDFAAYWRAERRWLAQHTEPAERQERLMNRVLGVIDRLPDRRLELAMQQLTAIPDLESRFTADDGMKLVAAVRAARTWTPLSYRMMELALLAPGDEVWRALLAAADQREGPSAREAISRIFALLGPDRVLISISEGSKSVRIAAMDEVGQLRDLRAVPALLDVVKENDADLQRSAVFALGRLKATAARTALLDLLSDASNLNPGIRRTAWVALARIGGDEVFPVLRDAFLYPDEADRRAVIQALGALRHPAAARELANIYALRGDDSIGSLALEYLRQQGDLLASPAARVHLDHNNPEVRRQFVMLLGGFQNPAALTDLILMLDQEHERLEVVAAIAGVTGQDLTARNNRLEFIRKWFEQNRDLPQSTWLLAALSEQGVTTTLRPEQFGPGSDLTAVPELVRLMVEGRQPYLRSLAARVLRMSTDKDFGTVGPLTDEEERRAIAERYSLLFDSERTAAGK